jgi:hypothetical protein
MQSIFYIAATVRLLPAAFVSARHPVPAAGANKGCCYIFCHRIAPQPKFNTNKLTALLKRRQQNLHADLDFGAAVTNKLFSTS